MPTDEAWVREIVREEIAAERAAADERFEQLLLQHANNGEPLAQKILAVRKEYEEGGIS